MKLKEKLRRVYKASQCCDKSDCRIAIADVDTLIKQYGSKPSLIYRKISLIKKMERVAE